MMEKRVAVEIDAGEHIQCICPAGVAVHEQDRCIYDTGQVLDIGTITEILADEPAACDGCSPLPRIVRCVTLQDQAKARENDLMGKMAMDSCRAMITELQLGMRLVRSRFTFDRKLLLVLFAAEERVDFRELVKRLATEQHCRVELRQIGVRDEAALIGGLGPCGRVQCCSSWLKTFESVNVRMARTQRLSLNPNAISGMCGRLKCCLRYEYDQYREALQGMPREGMRVETPDGSGRVVDVNTLPRRVRVRLEDERIMEYDVDDLH
jgi:cell fate regulator YaaT (PSP1 superfamily)